MSDVIQCPTCSKKFRLPAKPPATFTCTGCKTVMDLSGFAAAVPVAPAAPAAPVTRRSGGAPAPHARRGSHAAASRGRGRRGAEEEGEHEEGGRHHYAKKKDNTMMLAVGSGVAMLVLGVVAVLVLMKSKDEPPADKPATVAGAPVPGTPGAPPAATPGATDGATPAGPGAPEGTTPAAPSGPAAAPAAPGTAAIRGGSAAQKAEVKTYPFTPETTADEQNQISEAVNAAVEIGGRDGRDGEKLLIQMDLKSMPRLISEFKNIQDKYGLDKPEGLTRAMVVDRILRAIDGVQERTFKDTHPIHVNSEPKEALATIKRWNWWWDTGQYKTRTKPWDPRVDEADAGEDAGGN